MKSCDHRRYLQHEVGKKLATSGKDDCGYIIDLLQPILYYDETFYYTL
jgi:hypothetical protein